MSRKSRAVEQRTLTPSPPHLVTGSSPRGLMLAWLVALFAARWLMPTEASAEGLTLWLVQLVLVTAVGRTAWHWRKGGRVGRCDAVDGAIALLVLAQVVSALTVVCGVGNARAAINLAWEWIGSGVLIGLLRREWRAAGEQVTGELKSLCLGLSLAAGVLAGYGLWQHTVEFGEMARDYRRLTTEHDQLAESQSNPRRQQALQVEMTRQGISLDPEARQGLEDRLLKSRDVFGLFALANSFAGLLAVMLLVTAGLIRFSAADRRWSDNAIPIGLMIVIGYCLLLTKSRTALVGLAVGIGWWMLRLALMRRGNSAKSESSRSWLVKWLVAGVVVVGLAVGLAAVSGGLDKAVVSEAPKSLRYRLEWWHGTSALIREHFWFGTGPGNFRDHYLPHKLPESSEEIADPHNLVFDVWANAGTFGLIGLLACVGLMVGQVFISRVVINETFAVPRPLGSGQCGPLPNGRGTDIVGLKKTLTDDRARCEHLLPGMAWTSPAMWGVGLAFPLAAIGMELLGQGTDERLWWLGGIWWLLWFVGANWFANQARRVGPAAHRRAGPPDNRSLEHGGPALEASLSHPTGEIGPEVSLLPLRDNMAVALEAANVALLVHLLGAGGIAMPAITQLLWLVWTLRAECRESNSPSDSASGDVQSGRIPAVASLLVAASLCLACGMTATIPELLCRTSLQMGDTEWERRQVNAAQARYRDAIAADRWAIEPLDRMAELSMQVWSQTLRDSDFAEAVRVHEAVRDRLPFASRPYRRLGQVWWQRFERTQEVADAARSAAAFQAAVERYPHHAELLAEWAAACASAQQIEMARNAAQRALRQDDMNRAAGHSDKYLPDKRRAQMSRLADVSRAGLFFNLDKRPDNLTRSASEGEWPRISRLKRSPSLALRVSVCDHLPQCERLARLADVSDAN